MAHQENTKHPFMARYQDTCHGILRIMTGLGLLSHACMKILPWPAWQLGNTPLQKPLPFTPIWFEGTFEFVVAWMIILGLFTCQVAFLLSGFMAFAYWLVHGTHALVPASNNGESAYLYCFIFLWLSAAGAGPWSLDRRLAGKKIGRLSH